MQLIVITPETTIDDEKNIVNALFSEGLQRLHLRKPGFTEPDYRDYLEAIPGQYHSKIVVHNCFGLYSQYSLGGIHLNSYARLEKEVWSSVKNIPVEAISTSFHAWQEIRDNQFNYGYVFISPVFDSISKQGYKAGIDLSEAQKIKSEFAGQNRYCPKIVGLGGVGAEQVSLLKNHGFDSAALLGAIWSGGEPVSNFREVQRAALSL